MVFVPVTLVLLTRRVRGRRKLFWALLAVPFSWLACVALVLLVPPSPESEKGRTPRQQRTWVATVLAILTVFGPLSGLIKHDPLEAPPMFPNVPAESAYQVMGSPGYANRIYDALEEKHGGWLGWHRFFVFLLVIQKDRWLNASPYVPVVFPDDSKIHYKITQVSNDRFELDIGRAADAAGNLIHPREDAEKYRWHRGRLLDDNHIDRFVAYLSDLKISVRNEAVDGRPARWECRGPKGTMDCRVFSDQSPGQPSPAIP